MRANPSSIEATSLVERSAAEWAVRISSGPIAANEQAELDAWLAADSRHQGALVRAQAAWIDLDRLAAISVDPNKVSSARGASVVLSSPRGGARTAQTRRSFLAAGLGAIALTAGSRGLWLWLRRGEVYESGLEEVRRVTLPDGSIMTLDSSTRTEVHFGEDRREIKLVRGQGLFEVTKDSTRPFIVLARAVSVRAVGTAFAVRAVDQDVAVTVAEGVVEVADRIDGSLKQPERVTADQRAVVDATHGIKVQSIPAAQVERHLSWRDGMLSFDGETLAEAVKEINRHNTRQIAIDDPGLGARPVVGIFRSSDTEGFAQTVSAAMGAETRTDGDTIHLASHR